MNETLPNSNLAKNHDPAMFAELYAAAETNGERTEIRNKLKRLDSGRLYEFLEKAHIHIANGDLESRTYYAEIYGEELLRWVGAYGMVEDLNTFPKITGVER